MKAFHSGREAKEFLVSRMVAEAQRENVPLSEVERKMLHFTESGWTLPDMMAINEEFDRDYDQDEYEKKIARLIKNADKYARKESRDEYDAWWAAIRFLEKEDHYISVMIRMARLRPPGDQLKLLGAGLGIVAAVLLTEFLFIKYPVDLSRYVPSRDALFYGWAAAVCAVIAYSLLRFIMSKKKSGDRDGAH
jgi:hypothetical protein